MQPRLNDDFIMKLATVDFPDDWTIESAESLNDSWERIGAADRLPPKWHAVCTPDDGVMAAFPTYELAFSYMVLIIYGRGGPNPSRPDLTNYEVGIGDSNHIE